MSVSLTNTALTDGDLIVYKAAWASQYMMYKAYLDNQLILEVRGKRALKSGLVALQLSLDDVHIEEQEHLDPISHVLHTVKCMLENIVKNSGANGYVVYLTGSTNFRNDLFPIYKAGRGEKPKHYQVIRDYMIDLWDAVVTEGYEADDALGIAQEEDTIIASTDKDLDTVPGWHYNFDKDLKYFVSEEEAKLNLDLQCLTGDAVDNIYGIPGLGKVRSMNLLRGLDPGERYMVLEKYYKKQWGNDWDEMLQLNTSLLRILQEEPCSPTHAGFAEIKKEGGVCHEDGWDGTFLYKEES